MRTTTILALLLISVLLTLTAVLKGQYGEAAIAAILICHALAQGGEEV
jgi:hypothetical protein